VAHPLRVQRDPAASPRGPGADAGLDVVVDATPGATVGDLADELARLTGQRGDRSVVARWPRDRRSSPPARAALLSTHGPPAGATVALVDPPRSVEQRASSPVRLVSDDAELHLDYGSTVVQDVVVEVTGAVTVRAVGASTARVGGRALLGSARLHHGALLRAGSTLWTVHVGGPLQPPITGGWSTPHQSRPPGAEDHEPVTVRLPTPPAAVRAPGFPVLSATVPLLMGVALWIATGSLLAAGFMLFSVVFVVAGGLESRREARAEDRARVAEFRDELDDAQTLLDRLADDQRRRHRAHGWSPAELHDLLTAELVGPQVWQRGCAPEHEPGCTVRLGGATRPSDDLVVVPDQGRRALRAELRRLAELRAVVHDDVATLDLSAHGGLVIDAPGERAVAIARAVVLQLATAIGPDHLRIQLATAAERAAAWSALQWLPHTRSSRGRRLIVIDGDRATTTGLDDEAGADELVAGVAPLVLWVRPPGGIRPAGVHAMLVAHDGGAVLEQTTPSGVQVTELHDLDLLEHDECEPLARRLAALTPATAPSWSGSAGAEHVGQDQLPTHVSLGEVAASPDLLGHAGAVVDQWLRCTGPGLATPIGRDGRSGVVNIDLDSDGPHALVAGTTGSGKSELLRTFLVSAALHHPPSRLQLLLVDYKGGAAFGPLTELPHTVGTITDLSGALAPRALSSLRAELRRREQVVAAAGASSWDGPALLVVVDELATLVAEQPDFVDGLVDLAQRGRSLGVHLVLATQRPAGVVTDAIRANVTVRIALRVADPEDSRDIVDTPAAAHLPRRRPGRAIVRVGPGVTSTLQTAYCGDPPETRPPVRARWLTDAGTPDTDAADAVLPAGSPGQASELDTAVATVREAAERIEASPPVRPWLDPLPAHLELSDVPASDRPGVLHLGLVDRPEQQRRSELRLDLARDGGATIVGASGSGRSTALRTIVDAARRARDERWHVDVVDGAGDLRDLAGTGVVGDVIDVHDAERVLRLLRRTDREIRRRRSEVGGSWPRLVVAVDGIAAFEDRYERLDRGVAVDLLARIARDGRAVGVHPIITAHRRGEVPVGLAGLLPARIVLRCATADDAALLGLDDHAADPDLAAGRCHVGGHVAQVALPDAGAGVGVGVAAATGHPVVPPVTRLPTRVAIAELSASSVPPWQLAIGLDADTLEPAVLDLAHHHALVAGPPRSGVSTALAAIAAAHGSSRALTLADAVDLPGIVEHALAAAGSGVAQLVVLDELHELLEHPDPAVTGAVERLLGVRRDVPLRVVAGGEVDALSRSYHEAMSVLRGTRTGILLGDDPDLHASMWHASPQPRSDLPPAPGRGWLLAPGAAHPVQVATVL
jgi:S-DNA-T family DNA segregation ATPase FtsK/SpoIIIE